ncbi:hypothetical protein HY988_05930 [Candidatus Micrarchaeota archaeon]|nr:hypothetical protein [Candidatus Micrarchaeota archaeon]
MAGFKKPIVIIDGNGFAATLQGERTERRQVLTRYGSLEAMCTRIGGREVYSIRRDGEVSTPKLSPAHARVFLARQIDAAAILASGTVTLSNGRYQEGDFIVCRDLLRLGLELESFDGFAVGSGSARRRTENLGPFSVRLNTLLHAVGTELGIGVKSDAVLCAVASEGEGNHQPTSPTWTGDITHGEISAEVLLSAELGLPFSLLGIGIKPNGTKQVTLPNAVVEHTYNQELGRFVTRAIELLE